MTVNHQQEDNTMTLIPYVDEYACAAHGDCALTSPGVFVVEETAVFTGAGTDAQILAAARACPASAIVVTQRETGEQVYP